MPALIANIAMSWRAARRPEGRKIVRTTIGATILALGMVTAAWAGDGAAQPRAAVNPNVIACQKVTAAEMATFVGAPALIKETSANLCSWKGGKANAYASVMFFAGESHGVPAGAERAYFDQMIEGEKAKGKPGELVAVPGIGDSAWGLKLGQNETAYYAVYAFKGKDNITITTNGVGYDGTVAIARLAASRM
ncbi:MAG: hypothetical protein GY873_05115 [Bosea sp.]|uniref:hypothetical protein n=1 Tax=Bosea sp. (in: a-proteobacteria) TaxID=1871050 RepID=UPI00239718F0|nr:hypothetical protein [Bosea sp. (in: a-proteobacteria)]MCP4733558.1 hypothetical protein [Bosea sp. (in: a-proteobacteria)]